jgi:CheY-like chemotaxis protein
MSTPKKIVVVDDEEQIRRLVANSLPAPEFDVTTFGDGRDALIKLHDLAPDLILCDVMMPEMDGRTFFQVVKRSEQLRHVPFIFLSAVHATEQIVATLEAGADDFVNKPFSPPRLLAKVRAVLRLAGRTAPFVEDRRQGELQGELGAKGTLPLVKFCESVRLTGRLVVTAPGVTRWADFLGGELVQAGGQPTPPGEEPIDLLLAMQTGSYQVEQRKLDAKHLSALSEGPATPRVDSDEDDAGPVSDDDGPVHMPGGLLARLDVRGESITIQTEAENRPDFTVTTLIARDGQVLRKLESSWPHPLQRRADQAAADAHIRRQHERMVASMRDLTVAPPQAVSKAAALVDGALLAWAMSFVAEHARDLLGAVMTVALLRRTHGRLLREHETLRTFKVGPDGRVSLEPERVALPATAVPAVAGWLNAFLAEAGGMAEKAGRIRVRNVTHMMEADLDRIGFYSALGAAGAS